MDYGLFMVLRRDAPCRMLYVLSVVFEIFLDIWKDVYRRRELYILLSN
jgi:hypothetical protein